MSTTYRPQLRDVPAQILCHRHHLVNDGVGLDFVQHAVAVRVVEPEHDCMKRNYVRSFQAPPSYSINIDRGHQIVLTFQFIFRSARLQQRQIANNVFEGNLHG
jgi:hypothetical protein